MRKPGRVRECGWGHPPGMEEWDEELSCLRTDWELDNDWPVKKKKKIKDNFKISKKKSRLDIDKNKKINFSILTFTCMLVYILAVQGPCVYAIAYTCYCTCRYQRRTSHLWSSHF